MEDYEEGPDQAAMPSQEEFEQWLDEQMSSQEAADNFGKWPE